MNPEPIEPEQPVTGLGELEDEVSQEFLRAVRDRIDRRRTSGQLVSFYYQMPLLLLCEFAGLLGAASSILHKDKDRSK